MFYPANRRARWENIMKQCVVVGASHIEAIQAAATRDSVGWLQFVSLREAQYNPYIINGALNPALRSALAVVEQDSPAGYFLSLRGNEYNVLGLVNHPTPFDFVLKEQPHLPVRKNVEIIPYYQVRETLFEMIKGTILLSIQVFSAVLERSLFFIEPPPPIPDNQHIACYPGAFKHKANTLGISPPLHRYKLWRLQSLLIQEECRKHAITFLPVPQTARDNHGGCLKKGYWAADPTHANARYGALVIAQIDALRQAHAR